jgi:hypothetical protein
VPAEPRIRGIGLAAALGYVATIFAANWLIQHVGPVSVGFGVKKSGLASYGVHLASADSLAWSFNARRNRPLPGCTHKSCANCLRYALRWREEILNQGTQMEMAA